MRVIRAVGLGFALSVGCARLSQGEPARRDAALLAHSVSAATPPAPAPVATPDRPWVELLRMERYGEAFELIEAEPEAVQKEPLVRLAHGVAAQRANRSDRSLVALAALDAALPELAERVRRVRAEASLSAGDFRAAETYYRTRSDGSSRLRTAEALAKLGEQDAARGLVDALLKKAPARGSLCSLEAPARRLRASLLAEGALSARALEYRWLLLEAPLCPSSEGVDALLGELPASHRLKPADRVARARAFAEAGQVENVERELELCGEAQETRAGAREHLRGLARLRARRELPQAAELLCDAASLNAASAAERKFLAGRARERAGDDAAAHALYQEVFRAFPGSSFAEQAEYRNAQLAYATGRFDVALSAYEAYQRRYGARGAHAREVRDERAVTLLALGKPNAAKELKALADAANDERTRLRYAELEGVAWLRESKLDAARARFVEIAQKAPLSFYGLVAAARLQALGVPVPTPTAAPRSDNGAKGPLDVKLPPTVELLHRAGLDREAEAALAELEGSVLRDYSGRGEQALCQLYGQLAPAERRYRWGQRVASAEELSALPHSARGWLWDCVYPRPYAPLVVGTAEAHGVEPALIYAVMRQESSFRPEVASGAQAQGLLQLMPSTASRLASELGLGSQVDLRQPPLNVRLGAFYLSKLQAWFGNSLALTAAGYNAGPLAVLRWLRGAPSLELDVFVAHIPYDETRTYVERVLSNYARYRYLSPEQSATQLALTLPEPHVDGADLY
ncbi:MAG: transglycosylase SLT domain-containing protein [Polyangiaceae bacterium]